MRFMPLRRIAVMNSCHDLSLKGEFQWNKLHARCATVVPFCRSTFFLPSPQRGEGFFAFPSPPTPLPSGERRERGNALRECVAAKEKALKKRAIKTEPCRWPG